MLFSDSQSHGYHYLTMALLLAGAAIVGPASLALAGATTVVYEAEVSTVVGAPFGVAVPRLTAVTGHFTFDTSTPDTDSDPDRGTYRHTDGSAFLADFQGHEVTGSSTALYTVGTAGGTFIIRDGPGLLGNNGGTMSFNGLGDETIELFFSASPGPLTTDSLFNPFPLYDFESFIGTPHTFVIEDSRGRMLMQINSVETVTASTTTTTLPSSRCGDPGQDGVTATDALLVLRAGIGAVDCLPCICDIEGSGQVTATDALGLLRFAIGQGGFSGVSRLLSGCGCSGHLRCARASTRFRYAQKIRERRVAMGRLELPT